MGAEMALSESLPSNLKLDRITFFAAISTLLLLFATNYVFDFLASTPLLKSFSEAIKGLLFAVAVPVFNGLRAGFLRTSGVGPLPRQALKRNDIAAGLVAAICIILIFSIIGFFGGVA